MTAMPLLAAATPVDIKARGDGTCNTGPVQCCNTTATAGSAAGSAILGLLGIVLQDLNLLLGLSCSPISVIGAGLAAAAVRRPCAARTTAILISIGCIPIQL
ncbi:hypothetical protein C8Q74DRAFT_1372509 [Fomes fomentarius]|nr:hypothetical protein C8Q74DRAFT_1372509 [Fomes fomentarius]